MKALTACKAWKVLFKLKQDKKIIIITNNYKNRTQINCRVKEKIIILHKFILLVNYKKVSSKCTIIIGNVNIFFLTLGIANCWQYY